MHPAKVQKIILAVLTNTAEEVSTISYLESLLFFFSKKHLPGIYLKTASKIKID